jgi:hypothetical protein
MFLKDMAGMSQHLALWIDFAYLFDFIVFGPLGGASRN